ncbi:MAG: MFS transporter [Ilumatobacteraceae bacterium]
MAFQAPLRLLAAARPSVPVALLLAIATSTAVFTATPFLLPSIADEFDISVGTAGLTSTTQLAGFVVASWVGGRFLHPVRRVFVIGTLLGVAANALSALSPNFETLCALRFVSGLSLGLAAWIAWQAAFGNASKTGDVAVVGPLVGTVSAPLVALMLEATGIRWLFAALAVVAAVPLIFTRQVPKVAPIRPHQTRHAPTRAARVILVALCTLTLGGSAVFVYAAAIGTDLVGFSPFAVSLLFSANALAAIPSAKWTGRRGPAGLWFMMTACCALGLSVARGQVVFGLALTLWGFFFFMAVPSTFALLAERSNFPEERAGDAQAMMALGRVFGPLLGGAMIAAGSTTGLGIVTSSVMAFGGCLLLYVDRQRFVVARQFGLGPARASVDAT